MTFGTQPQGSHFLCALVIQEVAESTQIPAEGTQTTVPCLIPAKGGVEQMCSPALILPQTVTCTEDYLRARNRHGLYLC